MWYSIYNGTQWSENYTTSGSSGILNQTLWNTLGNGSLLLRFYVNDSMGNNISSDAFIMKDIIAPNITIQTPSNSSNVTTPTYSLLINESNLDSFWVSIFNGTHWSQNFTLSSTSGNIDQTLWDSMPLGSLLIRFYANDTAGNIGYIDINITKVVEAGETPDDPPNTPFPSPSIPGYTLILLFSGFLIIILVIRKNRMKSIISTN